MTLPSLPAENPRVKIDARVVAWWLTAASLVMLAVGLAVVQGMGPVARSPVVETTPVTGPGPAGPPVGQRPVPLRRDPAPPAVGGSDTQGLTDPLVEGRVDAASYWRPAPR